MAINQYRGHRDYHLLCELHKRKTNGLNDSDKLIINKKYDALFYAKKVSNNEKDSQDLMSAIHYNYEMVTIETTDLVEINKDDNIFMLGKKWLVLRVTYRDLIKTSQYQQVAQKIQTIVLRG